MHGRGEKYNGTKLVGWSPWSQCDNTYLEIMVIAVLELRMAEDERAVAHVRVRILVRGR